MYIQECEKCKSEMIAVLSLGTRLVGGVTAVLCPQCATEWNKFAAAHSVFQRLCELACIRDSIIHARELQHSSIEELGNVNLRRVLEELRECEATLHDVGLEWVGRVDGDKDKDKDENEE